MHTSEAKGAGLSRRSFLGMGAASAAAVAALGLTACSPQTAGTSNAGEGAPEEGLASTGSTFSWRVAPEAIADDQIAETHEADIVIVGAGNSGTSAARAAVEEGASVIVIEKQSKEYQTINGNDYGHINSQFNKDQGIPEYDPTDLLNDWQRRTANRSNPDLVRQFAQNCGDTFDWFIEPLGDDFVSTIRTFYGNVPEQIHDTYSGYYNFIGTAQFYGEDCDLSDAVRINQEYAAGLGAEFFFEMPGVQLVKEGDAVVGVIAQDADGAYHRFNAKKAVLLASGDYSANPEMVIDLHQELVEVCPGDPMEDLAGGMGYEGDGVKMGVWAGAKIAPGPRAAMCAPVSFMAGPLGGTAFLRVNNNGERFTNENMMGAWGSGTQSWRQPQGVICSIFGTEWLEELKGQAPDHANVDLSWDPHQSNLEADFANYQTGPEGFQVHDSTNSPGDKTSTVFAADTLEELGGYLGLSAEASAELAKSVERYNELCRTGKDEDYGKDANLMYEIQGPPFFGIAMPTGIALAPMNTMGGLMIDGKQRVLDATHNPIPGLYATGNTSGGRWGIQYSTPMAGCSIGFAHTLGRIAGQTLAAL